VYDEVHVNENKYLISMKLYLSVLIKFMLLYHHPCLYGEIFNEDETEMKFALGIDLYSQPNQTVQPMYSYPMLLYPMLLLCVPCTHVANLPTNNSGLSLLLPDFFQITIWHQRR
jgi:hypothetical protein